MALQKQQNESQLCPKRSTYRWIPIFFKSKTTTQRRSRSQVLVDHVPGERVPPCVCVFSPQNGKGSRSASRSSEVPTRANTLTSTEFLHRSQEMSSVSLYRPLPTSAGLSHLFFFSFISSISLLLCLSLRGLGVGLWWAEPADSSHEWGGPQNRRKRMWNRCPSSWCPGVEWRSLPTWLVIISLTCLVWRPR